MPIFESLVNNPEGVRIVVLDLDESLHRRGERVDNEQTARAKVEIERQITRKISEENGLSLVKCILTTRPAESILSDKKVLKEFLNLKLMIKDGEEIREVPLFLAYGELGAVRLLRKDLSNVDKDIPEEDKWLIEVDSRFDGYCAEGGVREKLIEFLQKEFVESGDYKFEEGRLVGVSLQNRDETPLTNEQKKAIKQKIEEGLTKEHLGEVAVELNGADVDIFPKELVEEAKLVGIDAILKWARMFLPSIDYDQMIMVDDSGFTVSAHIKKQKKTRMPTVKVVAPQNADNEMRKELWWLKMKGRGVLAEYNDFWGVMAGLYQVLSNQKLKLPKGIASKNLSN